MSVAPFAFHLATSPAAMFAVFGQVDIVRIWPIQMAQVRYYDPMNGLSRLSAVTTTGIYCRAGCPGRPKRRNVLGFGSQVAAEAAGFRPCLRCRPDRLPPLSAVDGGPDVIERALLLISEGALDSGREEELAARLNISQRQLRRRR